MKLNRKIAIVIPDLRGGGAERVVVNLVNEFITRGFSVDLILQNAVGVYLPEVSPEARIVDLNAPRLRNMLLPLIGYIRDEKPDALIANMWPLTGLSIVAKYMARISLALMVVEHTDWISSMKCYSSAHNIFMRKGMRLLFPMADAVVAVSGGAADGLSKLSYVPRSKVAAIYNPIVGKTEPPDADGIDLLNWSVGSHKKIIAVGAFKVEKNHLLLIKAFSLVAKKVDAKLLILGEGENRSEMESNVMDLGLVDSVFLPGFAANPLAYLRHSDLFVLSSDFEGFGNVVVEALQAGTPVVSTDCQSGPREILEDGRYGILTTVGDAEALASAMLKSLNSSHDNEALMARAQDFTIAKAADKYLRLLFPDGIGAANE